MTYCNSSSSVGILAWLNNPIVFKIIIFILDSLDYFMAHIVELIALW